MWKLFEGGKSIGSIGSETGTIILDDEHELGARITLEEKTRHAPFAITCGIYGWFCHTRFFSTKSEAVFEYEEMKDALLEILNLLAPGAELDEELAQEAVSIAVSRFVNEFP